MTTTTMQQQHGSYFFFQLVFYSSVSCAKSTGFDRLRHKSKCRSCRRRGPMTQTGPLFPIPFSRIPTNRNPPPNAAQNHAAGPPRGRCTSPHHDSSGTMEGESNRTAKPQRQLFLHKLHKLPNTNPTQHFFPLQLEICIPSTKIKGKTDNHKGDHLTDEVVGYFVTS